MVLYSIQHRCVWDQLRERGEYHGVASQVDAHWRHAYGWMRRQMQRQLGPAPAAGFMPVWAWRWWRGPARPRPDLRHRGHLRAGTAGVLLTLELAPSRVLLSDFELWHYVLNGWYLPANRADERRFARGAQRPPKVRARQIEDSWRRIFRIGELRPPYGHPLRSRAVQAVCWQLRLADVMQVREFKAR